MARKNNIRSMRFTDEIYDVIDRQAGRTFTEKFENLVTRCMWELPAREKELAQIQLAIEQEKRRLDVLRAKLGNLQSTATNLQWSAKALQQAIDKATKEWT